MMCHLPWNWLKTSHCSRHKVAYLKANVTEFTETENSINQSINQSNNLYSAECLNENRRRYREKLTNYVTVWSNKWVLSLPRKTPEEVKLRWSKGKEFQILGAATSKDLSEMWKWVRGMVSKCWSDERRERVGVCECKSCARYEGWWSCRAVWVRHAIL